LPGWSVGDVLAHLARNAEGHARRLEAALAGQDLPRYPGGPAQRDAGIAAGAGHSAAELAADLAGTARALEEAWARSAAAGWPHAELRGHDSWPTTASPSRRLREVEVHHADLGPGRPYRSFRGLLGHLATLTRNQVRFAGTEAAIPMLTEPTSAQREAFDLIGVPIPLTLK
jgi:uncharacterized protein (TIGR03083 family)